MPACCVAARAREAAQRLAGHTAEAKDSAGHHRRQREEAEKPQDVTCRPTCFPHTYTPTGLQPLPHRLAAAWPLRVPSLTRPCIHLPREVTRADRTPAGRGTFTHGWWGRALGQPLRQTGWKFRRKLKTAALRPAPTLLGAHPTNIHTVIQRDSCPPMFTAATPTTAALWVQRQCAHWSIRCRRKEGIQLTRGI